MNGSWARTARLLLASLLVACSGRSSDGGGGDGAPSPDGVDDDAGAQNRRGRVVHDGPVCAYLSYTEADYAGFADGGTLPNLPCGGCAPASEPCSPDGVTAGNRFKCWSSPGYPRPPASGRACTTIAASSGIGPTLWEACCI
jgi:hypothetical protein